MSLMELLFEMCRSEMFGDCQKLEKDLVSSFQGQNDENPTIQIFLYRFKRFLYSFAVDEMGTTKFSLRLDKILPSFGKFCT
jgi:hypothetical protein